MIPDRKTYPAVSIIVPVYNAETIIEELLESLFRLDYPEEQREIIVVDNNSSDRTPDVIKRYPVTLLTERLIQSSYAARNRGAAAARGTFLVFTDSDCIVIPSWLSKLLENHQDETVGIFAGKIESYSRRSWVEKFGESEGVLDQSKFLQHEYMPYAVTANMAIRRELFEKIGCFNPSLTSGGDADFCWRLQKETGCHIQYMPDAIVYHKHRHSVKTLYHQYRKYGRGVYHLQKLHPQAYPMVSTTWWWKDAQDHFKDGCAKLWRHLFKNSEGDASDWRFSFLRSLCFFGLAMGRAQAIINDRRRKGRCP